MAGVSGDRLWCSPRMADPSGLNVSCRNQSHVCRTRIFLTHFQAQRSSHTGSELHFRLSISESSDLARVQQSPLG